MTGKGKEERWDYETREPIFFIYRMHNMFFSSCTRDCGSMVAPSAQ